jgi:hypothetical protein
MISPPRGVTWDLLGNITEMLSISSLRNGVDIFYGSIVRNMYHQSSVRKRDDLHG